MTSETSRRASTLLQSAWLHALLLGAATLAAWLSLGFAGMPLTWDPAYFTYMGQAILRGEPIYAHTFMAYPPVGPLLSAGAMIIAGWLDAPSYLAPRFVAVACGVGSVLCVYAVTRRATANAWAGLAAGLILAGFHLLARSSLATLEPKHLVIFFSLAAAAACQRQRWALTGGAAALAVSSYQPAILVPVAFGLMAWHAGRRRAGGSLLAYAVGFGVGLLPTLIYITATAGWADFWVRGVLLTSSARLPTAGQTPFHWLSVIRVWYASEFLFFVAAGLGWLTYALESLWRRRHERLDAWLGAESAGMPLLGALVCVAAMIEFQGYPDAYPLLPFVAFWAAWFSHRLTQLGVNTLRTRRSPGPALRVGLGVAWVLLAAWVGFRDLPNHPRSAELPRQLAEVRRIAGAPDDKVMAFFAEEIYVLSERPSPQPFLRLPRIFVPFLPYAGYRDCAAVAAQVVAQRPQAVALRIMQLQGGCEPIIGRALVANGYVREQAPFNLLVYWSDDAIRRARATVQSKP